MNIVYTNVDIRLKIYIYNIVARMQQTRQKIIEQ